MITKEQIEHVATVLGFTVHRIHDDNKHVFVHDIRDNIVVGLKAFDVHYDSTMRRMAEKLKEDGWAVVEGKKLGGKYWWRVYDHQNEHIGKSLYEVFLKVYPIGEKS